MKPLIANFIRATKDADAASTQSRIAKEWMAQMLMQLDASWTGRREINSLRTFTRIQQFIGDLLGGPTMEEELRQHTRKFSNAGSSSDERALQTTAHGQITRVHDTVSVDVAYVALAARANGADLCVECVGEHKISVIPSNVSPSEIAFRVRLWLCQPPPQIGQILRFSDTSETATYMSTGSSMERLDLTVFGGQLEIATAAASAVGYEGVRLERENLGPIFDLWKKGFEKGLSLSWTVKSMPNRLYPLRFKLVTSSQRSPPETAMLAQLVARTDDRLDLISREIATIIDEVYNWSSYTHAGVKDEMTAATRFVNVAIAVGSLHKITKSLGNDKLQYALNLKTIERDGSLVNLCPKALTEGLPFQELLWAASRLWGGASSATQGYALVNDSVQGIVAPHGVVILDIIRSPLQFVRDGMSNEILSMCRGSVPLLSRDPSSGFVLGPDNKHTEPERQEVDFKDTAEAAGPGRLAGDLVITFEPDVLGRQAFRSIFCCSYMGNLAFEVDPIIVFKNMLARGTEVEKAHELLQVSSKLDVHEIRSMDLLQLGAFKIREGVACVRADSPGWLVAVAGLAQPGRTIFQRLEEIDWEMCRIETEDAVILSTLKQKP